jgi:precorrin-3B synthase
VSPTPPSVRTRRDRCPGVLRPWPADDGALVRVRLAGGRLAADALAALSVLAAELGDGDLHLTSRGNVQVRGVSDVDSFADGVERLGLLPSRAHDLARNLVASPFSGLRGGRVDVRPLVRDLDERLCADPALAALPGRFQLTLDDGRGDLLTGPNDLGAVALDVGNAQLRLGSGWGPVVPLDDVVGRLLDLAVAFLDVRGAGVDAPWHVDELPVPLLAATPREPRVPAPADPPPYDDRAHVEAPDGVLAPEAVARLVAPGGHLVVTPWRSVVVEQLVEEAAA